MEGSVPQRGQSESGMGRLVEVVEADRDQVGRPGLIRIGEDGSER